MTKNKALNCPLVNYSRRPACKLAEGGAQTSPVQSNSPDRMFFFRMSAFLRQESLEWGHLNAVTVYFEYTIGKDT